MELVDTPALGAGAVMREGSSPFIRTRLNLQRKTVQNGRFFDTHAGMRPRGIG